MSEATSGSAQLPQPALPQVWLPRAQGSASLRSAPAWNPSSWASHAPELWNAACAFSGLAHLSSELFSVLSSQKRKTRRLSGCCLHGVFPSQFLLPGLFLLAWQAQGRFPGAWFWHQCRILHFHRNKRLNLLSYWISLFILSGMMCILKQMWSSGGFVCKLNK